MNSTVYTNMDSVRNYNIFTNNQSKASSAMTRATTGLRIASVQDGPADWAISERMRERINSLTQASQNTQNDTSMMKTAEGGISNIVSILTSLREKAIQASDASASDEDRTALQKEANNLLYQVDDIANSTKYNGISLLAPSSTTPSNDDPDDPTDDSSSGGDDSTDDASTDTSASDTASVITYADQTRIFQIGDDPTLKINVDLPDMRLSALGLVNPSGVTTSPTDDGSSGGDDSTGDDSTDDTSTDPRDTTVTIAKNQAIDLSSREGALKSMKAIERALNTALDAATGVGSLENRLGYTYDNLTTQIENLQSADSTIRDANMAQEISNYMKWSVLSQASQYMLAQSNQNAFSVLNLLQ